jgi:hypothetical protein
MAQKEIVMNIKLDAGEAIQQIKELAVNTGELKDRKKLLNDEIKAEEKALKELAKLQEQGINVDKQLVAQEEKLARVRKQNREEIALLDTALRGNSGRMRELTNDVSGLTEEGLRFRDKMADAFAEAFAPLAKEITVNLSVAQRKMAEALREFGAQSNQFQQAAAKAATLEKAIDEVKQAQAEATAAIKQFGENSKEFAEANERLKALEVTAKGLSDEVAERMEPKFEALNRQLRQARKEAQEMAETFGFASQEFKQAAERADDLDDQIKAVNARIGAIDTEGKIETFGKALQGVTGAFSVAQGAAALFGDESEAVEQALLKVQAALAIQQGVSGIIEGAKAARAFATSIGLIAPASAGATAGINGMKAALIASGIGAAVLLIGALASSMMDFGEATEDAAAGQERLNKAFDNARASQQRNLDFLSQEKLLLLEQKKLAEGRTEDTKQDIEERNRIIAAGLQNQITLTVLALKREEDAVKKAKAAELEAFRTGSEEQQKAASEALDKAEQRRAESAQKQKDLLNEQKIFALQSANELSSFDIDAQDKASQAAEEAAKKREQLSEDELRLRQEIAQRSVELTNQQILLEETLLNEASDARLTALQREENAILDKYFTAITNAKAGSATELQLIADRDAELAAARKKAADDEVKTAQDTAEKIKKIQDDIYAYQQDILNKKLALIEEDTKAFTDGVSATRDIALGFGELQQQLTENELADIDARIEARRKLGQDTTALEAERERVAKQAAVQAFNMQRNAALAQVAIDTAAAISALVAASAKNPANGVTAGAAGAAQFAAGIAQITVQMAKVATLLAQKPPGFAEGGYTGSGGKYEPAGIVHRGEYVLPQEVVRALGVQRLDALRSMYTGAAPGRGSYATGGMVQATLSSNAIFAAQNAAAANTMNLQPVLPVESLRAVMNRVEVREARATL